MLPKHYPHLWLCPVQGRTPHPAIAGQPRAKRVCERRPGYGVPIGPSPEAGVTIPLASSRIASAIGKRGMVSPRWGSSPFASDTQGCARRLACPRLACLRAFGPHLRIGTGCKMWVMLRVLRRFRMSPRKARTHSSEDGVASRVARDLYNPETKLPQRVKSHFLTRPLPTRNRLHAPKRRTASGLGRFFCPQWTPDAVRAANQSRVRPAGAGPKASQSREGQTFRSHRQFD